MSANEAPVLGEIDPERLKKLERFPKMYEMKSPPAPFVCSKEIVSLHRKELEKYVKFYQGLPLVKTESWGTFI